jgi:ADP-ribosylglycohydrolase
MAVNLGDDADTVGAIYGQLAGAYYGLEGIPAKWHSKIVQRDMILKMADDLFALPRTLRY